MALNEEALQALKTELLDELVKEDPSKSQLAERLAEIRSADIGEVLEERFQIEDNLIEKMHNVHREAVAS